MTDDKAACINAFVMGADWMRYELTKFTAFPSERDEAEEEAKKRYPFIPRDHMTLLAELRAYRDKTEAALLTLCASTDDIYECEWLADLGLWREPPKDGGA